MLIAATVMPITGIGARSVGVVIGLLFFVLAFFPKVTVILIAIPGPVAGAYITVLLGLLFVQGMKIVIQDGVDHRKAAVVGCPSESARVSRTSGFTPTFWAMAS